MVLYALAAIAAVSAATSLAADVVPFAILMQMRVGSTWFTSTLEQHPDVLGEMEICNEIPEERVEQCGQRIAEFHEKCAAFATKRAGVRSWCGFKEKIEHLRPQSDLLYRPQAPNSSIHFPPYHFVHLYRGNIVKQAVSLAVAEVTQAWTCMPGTNCTSNSDVQVTAKAVMEHVEEFKSAADKDCNFLHMMPAANVLEISYEDLVANPVAVIRKVEGFLGLPRWSNWTEARERQSDEEHPFKALSGQEQKLLRKLLKEQYPWSGLERALDGDVGFLELGACSVDYAYKLRLDSSTGAPGAPSTRSTTAGPAGVQSTWSTANAVTEMSGARTAVSREEQAGLAPVGLMGMLGSLFGLPSIALGFAVGVSAGFCCRRWLCSPASTEGDFKPMELAPAALGRPESSHDDRSPRLVGVE
mmetsp:Transcript_93699/g.269876  ORF Transcript_93699/g.269876 Transcript_93699/m.269876 type:complete len:415 (-) Transcript_93699:187-1431(-)